MGANPTGVREQKQPLPKKQYFFLGGKFQNFQILKSCQFYVLFGGFGPIFITSSESSRRPTSDTLIQTQKTPWRQISRVHANTGILMLFENVGQI